MVLVLNYVRLIHIVDLRVLGAKTENILIVEVAQLASSKGGGNLDDLWLEGVVVIKAIPAEIYTILVACKPAMGDHVTDLLIGGHGLLDRMDDLLVDLLLQVLLLLLLH